MACPEREWSFSGKAVVSLSLSNAEHTNTSSCFRKGASLWKQTGNVSACWQRSFADDKKIGREGTTGEELSGDPNRVPKKGDNDREGKGAMDVSHAHLH